MKYHRLLLKAYKVLAVYRLLLQASCKRSARFATSITPFSLPIRYSAAMVVPANFSHRILPALMPIFIAWPKAWVMVSLLGVSLFRLKYSPLMVCWVPHLAVITWHVLRAWLF